MTDPFFEELAATVRLHDDDYWARRDREVATMREKQNAASELVRMRQRATLLRENGFTDDALHGALLANPETVALGHARQFRLLPAKMLVLAGGVGVGKTTAATWLALKADDSEPGFLRASELERRGRYDRAMAPWLNARTSLVLDDLGAEVLDGKGVFVSLLDELIDRFYSARAILVITTNLAEKDLGERYGARAWTRFEQRGCWASSGMRDLRKELP